MKSTRTISSENFKSHDLRALLQNELAERCRKNPNYSLRSFAKSLSIGPSALCQIINGKRSFSQKMKFRLGSALGLTADEINSILPTDLHSPEKIIFQRLDLDTFALISDWYHYAILEMISLDKFKPDPRWIAKSLGITQSEANFAIQRLFRLGFIKKNPDGTWKDTSENGDLTHIEAGISSQAAREYQRQLLDLSKKAVAEIPISKRNHTSVTISFNSNDMEEAIQDIANFRRQFARKFQRSQMADEVYQMQISFYPLTQSFIKQTKPK